MTVQSLLTAVSSTRSSYLPSLVASHAYLAVDLCALYRLHAGLLSSKATRSFVITVTRMQAGPKKPFFVSRRTTCYGRRTTCLVREDKVCPPSLSKRPTKLATKQALTYSKRRKFRPKMRQNAFGGRAPAGPAGGA